MFAKVLIGLLLALLLVPHAEAASFDCGKARTPFAKAVCGNPDLSKADDTLAQTFQTALNGLSVPAKTEVQGAQDAWVKYANIACTKDAKVATKPYDQDGISCLKNLFSERTEQLQNNKMLGGLRIYYVDRYAALRDPDSRDDNVGVAIKSVSTPRIDGADSAAAAFNNFIQTGTTDVIDSTIADNPKPADGSEDDANSLIVTTVNPVRITMTVNSYTYGHGAAHGNYATTYIHYLRGKNRPLTADDLFAGKDWRAHLQTLALAMVKKAMGDDLMLDDPSSLNNLVVDPTRWDFSKDGLILQFEPYEIAPYAAGAPTVSIPWSDLTADLGPKATDFQN